MNNPSSRLGAGDTAEAKFAEYLAALYAQRPPDLIVAVGAPAAHFVQRHRTDLYPTTPMLLAAVEVRRVEKSMLSEQDAMAGVHLDEVALFENISATVAGDENHRDDIRKLSQRAILGRRAATDIGSATGEQG